MPTTNASKIGTSSEKKIDAALVLRALNEFCANQEAGTVVPTYTELMRRYHASERSVRWALEELVREGKIVRRQGARTCVAPHQPKTTNLAPEFLDGAMSGTRQQQTIVAIAAPDHAFFDLALEVLHSLTESAGVSLVCRPFNPTTGVALQSEKAMGYLLFGRALAPLANQLQADGNRVVLIATPSADDVFEVPHVRGDQQKGGYLVTRHLIELGHRRIAIRGSGNFENRHSPRVLGHQKAVQEAKRDGIEVETSFITTEQFQSWKQDLASAQRFWEQPTAPTAVALWNDHESVFFLGFLNYLGVRVPQQVSLVGYDNLPASQQCHPTLTTVDSALESQLQAALDLLTQPQAPNPHHSVMVLPALVCRDSSAPVAH